MSEKLRIKSRLRDYGVSLIQDFENSIIQSHSAENCYFMIDARLLELYSEKFSDIRDKFQVMPVEATEHHKTLEFCQTVIDGLIDRQIRKNCTLIAIGGGIIQDITAFISSILFRGINWIFYPTTLLAQADSCIGSKTSINLGEYKNLLGGFYPPENIFIDTGFLETLPIGEIKSGIGEILHFYLIANSNLTEDLMRDYDLLIKSPRKLEKYLMESLKIKKKVIEIDEFDTNERNIFNYGHTFGHAIESTSGYGISHGQAVTMGMDIANYISLKLGYLQQQEFDRMNNLLVKNMPSFRLTEELAEKYFEALARDKKNIGNNLGCILTSGPGLMKKEQVPFDNSLKKIILSYFDSPAS
jgi:3-dehydroquinate synthase